LRTVCESLKRNLSEALDTETELGDIPCYIEREKFEEICEGLFK